MSGFKPEFEPWMFEQKREVADTIEEIWALLCALPSPRHAAMALAGVHCMVIEAGGEQTESSVRACLKESETAVLDAWSARSGVALAS